MVMEVFIKSLMDLTRVLIFPLLVKAFETMGVMDSMTSASSPAEPSVMARKKRIMAAAVFFISSLRVFLKIYFSASLFLVRKESAPECLKITYY
jgi:hypothetical protein